VSSEEDKSSKTEEPTQKKLDEARKKGQVAKSQEVNHWFMIVAFALLIGLFGPAVAEGVMEAIKPFLMMPHDMASDFGALSDMLTEAIIAIAFALALPLGIAVAAGMFANFVQIGPLMSAEQLKPKMEKISLIKGFQRLFSVKSLVEFAKGIAKLSIVTLAVVIVVYPYRAELTNAAGMGMSELLELLRWMAVKIIVAVLAVMLVIAVLDFSFQKYKHHQDMMMSKQEVKDEHKQSEGDPQVKQKLRQLRQEKSRRRMISQVPDATAVVTNPTHFAVALKYVQGEMAAPRVVAKGVDLVAYRIREVARENDVPVIENPPLARALYDTVDLDQEVPPEHYRAVAQVISYVMRLRDGRPSRRAVG
jgi:flagellar biosynthetic protein FlhB